MQFRLHRFFDGRQRAIILIAGDGWFYHHLLLQGVAPEAAADLLRTLVAYFEVERLLVAHEVVDIYL